MNDRGSHCLVPLVHYSLETLAISQPRENDVILMPALPPYAFVPRASAVQANSVALFGYQTSGGARGFKDDAEKGEPRFERAQPDGLATSLAQTVQQIETLPHLIALLKVDG
jgi:hypothetical protein